MLSVKSIFKTLIGTVVLIVVGSLLVEVFNINTTGLQIRQMTKMAARQACVLFSQETYKEETATYENKMPDVIDASGGIYISGSFYGNQDAASTYNSIYRSGDFTNWCNSAPALKGNWQNIKLISMGLTGAGTSASEEDKALSEAYAEMMLTPLNLGIPYLDKDTLTRILRWNLASIASNCSPDLIVPSSGGTSGFVRYKGFKVYADRATITNLSYIVLDLEDTNDRVRFVELTNINPGKLGFSEASTEDERRRVCLVSVEYAVPVAYEGITPIANIVNFVGSYSVEGIDGANNSPTGTTFDDTQIAMLESGGVKIRATPDNGKLLYYVIR